MFLRDQICLFLFLNMIGISLSLFEGCNNEYFNSDPNTNRMYILNSPYYPDKYPSDTSCMYTLTVPQDYEIVANCSISLPKGENSCTTDFFFISRNGDQNLNGAEQFCGSGNLTRTSLFSKIVIAYTSTSQSDGGRFSCKLTTRLQACDCGWSSQRRILGGVPAKQYEYPSIVSLQLKTTQEHFCAGTIINHRYIATAAHCTRFFGSPLNIQISAGYNGTVRNGPPQFTRIYEAEEFIEYPTYDWTTSDNDIALVKTIGVMEWSYIIGPICLPFDSSFRPENLDYGTVDLVGWGTTFFAGPVSNNLLTASVNVIPNTVCQNYAVVKPSQLCTHARGKDACQRDSGGPVVLKGNIREYLVGIISKGNICGNGPAINTRITSYVAWIYQITKRSLCYKPHT